MHNPELHKLLINARTEELRRSATTTNRVPRPPLPIPAAPVEEWVTLRFAFPDDHDAIARLASLDSAVPPPPPVLVAEVSGSLRAALSLADGAVIADPFHPNRALIELLHARARQLSGAGAGPRRRWSGLRSRFGLAAWR